MNLITIKIHPHAPPIADKLKEDIENILNTDDVALGIQLSYHEHHDLFYLKKISLIYFNMDYLEIRHKNNTVCYLDYNEILEYCILNAEDLLEREEI